jgi:malate synthase
MPDISISDLPLEERSRSEILTDEALAFLAELHGRFDARRLELLAARHERRAEIAAGGKLDFLPETREIREDSSWQAVAPRQDYADRWVEIIGPTDRKLVIDALNSGAKGFMADFEDANSPTWSNQVSGHVNLVDAIEGTITYETSDGRHYELAEDTATLMVRLRGLHLPERHVSFDGTIGSGSLVDFGLFAFHGAPRLAAKGLGAYLYLPKMEHHLEARLWDEVLTFAEDSLGLDRGQFRATVLIETLPAAFQMEEILYELREHSYGMNAGRWDYIFSAIKTFRERPDAVLPDRAAVTMTVPFMRAYTELLVRTCHGRGTFAMGGLSALIPSRTDAEANERAIAAVRADKEREAGNGFDGTWVAHPDVVGVASAAFGAVLGERPNQIERKREDVVPDADALTDLSATPGRVTEAGLRSNISVGFQYLSFWLCGRGAVVLNNQLEDAATVEISRSQIWQWVHNGTKLDGGTVIDRDLVVKILDEELAKIRAEVGEETWEAGRPEETRRVFEAVSLGDEFPDFLTEMAYQLLD